MDVHSLTISKLFSSGGDVIYLLPHFQREYAWDKSNWKTLLHDIFGIYNVYSTSDEPEHFMGAMVVIEDGTRSGTIPAFKLVDGQQRLITISLILVALSELVEPESSLHKKISKMLVNPDETQAYRYKLVPTKRNEDRRIYHALISGTRHLEAGSRIIQAYTYISQELQSRARKGNLDLEQLFLVISNCLQVVFINLNDRERPYEIVKYPICEDKCLRS